MWEGAGYKMLRKHSGLDSLMAPCSPHHPSFAYESMSVDRRFS